MTDFNKAYLKNTFFFIIIILFIVFIAFKAFDLILTDFDLIKTFFLSLIYRIAFYPFAKKKES